MRKITEIENFVKKTNNNLVWSDMERTVNTNVEITDILYKSMDWSNWQPLLASKLKACSDQAQYPYLRIYRIAYQGDHWQLRKEEVK